GHVRASRERKDSQQPPSNSVQSPHGSLLRCVRSRAQQTGTTRAVTERVLGVKAHGACYRSATIVRSLTLGRSPNLIPRHGRLARGGRGTTGAARAPPGGRRVGRHPGRRRGNKEGEEGDPRPPRGAGEVGPAGEADPAAAPPASPADRPGEGLQHPALELAGA